MRKALRFGLIICLFACNPMTGDPKMNAAEKPDRNATTKAGTTSPVSQPDVVDIPIVIAHRGASGYVPEHTTEGVAMSHAMGADYIEQDVVLTKDSVPVVLHDLYLDDVTDVADVFPGRQQADGKFYAMDFLLSEIRQLTLNERCSPSRAWKNSGTRYPIRKGHFRIGTLAEHIELIQGLNQSRRKNAGLYVEIKDPARHHQAGLDSAKAILAVLTKYGYTAPGHRIFLQCFDPVEVYRVRTELDCRLPIIQLLTEIPDAETLRKYSTVADGLGVPLQAVVSGANADGTPVVTSLVPDAKALAMQVHVWTFRTDALPEFAPNVDTMISWLVRDGGVDGILSDQPDVVLQWRAAQSEMKPVPAGIRLIQN
ncbi:MAG: glycerophosphodiester phosphodiesterase [Planctomyces sp.]